jgi:hypothetical protein
VDSFLWLTIWHQKIMEVLSLMMVKLLNGRNKTWIKRSAINTTLSFFFYLNLKWLAWNKFTFYTKYVALSFLISSSFPSRSCDYPGAVPLWQKKKKKKKNFNRHCLSILIRQLFRIY